MESVGLYLKAQREKKGIRLEEIASITKIHIHSLELIEGSHWESLPPEPFIRGFIIAYAKYIGLDARDVISKYLEEVRKVAPVDAETAMGAQSDPTNSRIPSPSSPLHSPTSSGQLPQSPADVIQQMRPFPGKKVLTLGFTAVMLVLAVVVIYVGKNAADSSTDQAAVTPVTNAPEVATGNSETENKNEKKEGELPLTSIKATPPTPASGLPSAQSTKQLATKDPRSPAAATTPNVAKIEPKKVEPKPEVKPAPKKEEKPAAPIATAPAPAAAETAKAPDVKHELKGEVKDFSWLKVVIDDLPPKTGYLKPGTKLSYGAKSKIKLVLGKSSKAEVFYNGQPVEGTEQGTIRYYIFPRGSRFPQEVAKKPAATSESDDDKPATDDANVKPKHTESNTQG